VSNTPNDHELNVLLGPVEGIVNVQLGPPHAEIALYAYFLSLKNPGASMDENWIEAEAFLRGYIAGEVGELYRNQP
jgi:hypothetical protein